MLSLHFLSAACAGKIRFSLSDPRTVLFGSLLLFTDNGPSLANEAPMRRHLLHGKSTIVVKH
jgi:hypothetical protein